MTMITLKVILIVLLLVQNFHIGQFYKIEIISDVIKSYYKPSQAVVFSCNEKAALKPGKEFFKMDIMFRMQDINTRPIVNLFPDHEIVFILDINCTTSTGLLQYANNMNLLRSPYRWIIFNDNKEYINNDIYYQQFAQIFSNLNILVDCDIILIFPINNDNYNLIQIYKEVDNASIKYEKYAYWNQKHRLYNIVKNRVMATRRINLNQVTLKAVIVITNNNTFNHLTDYKYPDIDSITKANYFIVKHAAEIMNVSLTYVVEGTWGYRNKDTGEWSGLIGRLHKKEAHIAGTALFLTKDRIPIVEYLPMATPTKSKFVFRQPKLSYVTNVYQLPFQINCWIATLFLVIITAMALYIAVKWEAKYKNKLQKVEISTIDDSLEEIILITIAAVCQQGTFALPSFVSGRIISIFLYLALMFLYTSYAANIVSLLQTPSTKIKTLSDLLHSRLEFGVHDTVFNRFYFPTNTEPIRKAIYEQKISPSGKPDKFMSMNEGVARMRAGLFAFHFEEGAGYKRIQETFFEHEKCGLKDISYLEVPYPFLCVQKDLSYVEHLKIAYCKINERGFNNREVNRVYMKKPRCESHGSGFISVGIVDCYPLAVIFCIGVLLSLGSLTIEVYVHLRSRKGMYNPVYKWWEQKFKKT